MLPQGNKRSSISQCPLLHASSGEAGNMHKTTDNTQFCKWYALSSVGETRASSNFSWNMKVKTWFLWQVFKDNVI